uniref:Transmembrane protein n=1 Tax=Medicago truncatula TaxID=3880 RepID=I3SZW5_MEDTR|nr:unknown [Medicago truncatula]
MIGFRNHHQSLHLQAFGLFSYILLVHSYLIIHHTYHRYLHLHPRKSCHWLLYRKQSSKVSSFSSNSNY